MKDIITEINENKFQILTEFRLKNMYKIVE